MEWATEDTHGLPGPMEVPSASTNVTDSWDLYSPDSDRIGAPELSSSNSLPVNSIPVRQFSTSINVADSWDLDDPESDHIGPPETGHVDLLGDDTGSMNREIRGPDQASRTSRDPSLRSDMTHAEGRQYSQFLLHDIQRELSEGDTLIFVDFPNSMRPADNVDCFFFSWNSVQFRMPSQTLLATGSSKFAEMLGPSYQFRILRRRKLANRLPEGIKFVLDLTPPSEGDELVFQMTEASLTPGIISWWTAFDKHRVDGYVVSGHDDVCSCWKDGRLLQDTHNLDSTLDAISTSEAGRDENVERDPQMERAIRFAIAQSLRETMPENNRQNNTTNMTGRGTAAKLLEKKSRGDFSPEPIPAYREIPDYCPIRHRVNILRLMCLIANKHVLIDSAPRLWTLVAVAKILDCTDLVRDRALQWLMSPNNTVFIEILPEESLQIGVALRLDSVTRAAFRILVNELAIEEAAVPDGVPKAASASYTVFGRKRHDPGDDLSNLIQHAARVMVERFSISLQRLMSANIYDDLRIVEWQRLHGIVDILSTRPGDHSCRMAKSKAEHLIRSLQTAWEVIVVSESLNKLMDHDILTRIDDKRATYVDILHFSRFDLIYSQFNDVQKALCPFMYDNIDTRLSYLGGTLSGGPRYFNFDHLSRELWASLRDVLIANPQLRSEPAWEAALKLPRREPINSFNSSQHAFNPDAFLDDINLFLRTFQSKSARHDLEIPMLMTGHLLLTLTQEELKFLPLWAGGNDDGTGGVFEPSLPPTEYGPAGPGPAYHTGITIPSDASSTTGSVSSIIRQLRLEGGSTVGPGSVDVQDGISTVFNPKKVVADDVSVGSESFTDGDSEFVNAKYAVPVDGQSIASAVDAVIDTPDQSDADTNLASDDDDDDDDMTEVAPEDSLSREITPEFVMHATATAATGDHASSTGDVEQTTTLSAATSTAPSATSLDDDYDLIML